MDSIHQSGRIARDAVAPLFLAGLLAVSATAPVRAAPDDPILAVEQQRIQMIQRVTPAVTVVMDRQLRAGGSGVLISPDGYGLTNFHVVSGLLDKRTGWVGLGNSDRYLMEVLGVDVTGDVAMFKLYAPDDLKAFPYVPLGDSSAVKVGDVAIAMGNPFNLSEDYTPTVTYGLVTGVERYQWGVRGNLTYTHCIQVDASINPGNSGGPLFNADGEVIGINGRISINERGRFNVGFGYAIASNQIKRFIPSLRAGLLARHGTWQARVEALPGQGLTFVEILKSGPSYRSGLRTGDILVSLDGEPVSTVNQVVSLLGTYPASWPVVVEIKRAGSPMTFVVRLDPVDPNTRKPYKAPVLVNLRETQRVLTSFQHIVFGDKTPAVPDEWQWKVNRRDLSNGGNKTDVTTYTVKQPRGSRARMQQVRADGVTGDLVEYDAESAIARIRGSTENYDVNPDRAMVLAASYIMQSALLGSLENLHLTEIRHVGGDALVPTDPKALDDIPRRPNGLLDPRLLEVIEWPMTENTTARFAFDAETGRLVRTVVSDTVANTQITIYWRDYEDVGGIMWPTTKEVIGTGIHYLDRLTDWKVAP